MCAGLLFVGVYQVRSGHNPFKLLLAKLVLLLSLDAATRVHVPAEDIGYLHGFYFIELLEQRIIKVFFFFLFGFLYYLYYLGHLFVK